MGTINKLLAILLLVGSAYATTPVSGNLKDLTGTASGTFARFYLRGCRGNQPRVNGTALISPAADNTWYKDFAADASGVISGTIYATRDAAGTGNGEIECGAGIFTSTWYGVVIFSAGQPGPEIQYHAKNGVNLNLNNATPITTSPVSNAPVGDSTYLRIDGGNWGASTGQQPSYTGAATVAQSKPCYDSADYANLQAGVTAAGTTGCVLIRPDYAGTDSYTNPNGIPIIDYRGKNNDLRIMSVLETSRPYTDGSARLVPYGADLNLWASGAADAHWSTQPVELTSTTTCTASLGCTPTVGTPTYRGNSVTTGCVSAQFYLGAPLVVEPSNNLGGNQEVIAAGNWTAPTCTSLSFTGSKTHTQPYTIRQQGSLIYRAGQGVLPEADPTGKFEFANWLDINGNIVFAIPINAAATFPKNATWLAGTFTGGNGVNRDFAFRNNNAASLFKLQRSTDGANCFTVDDNGNLTLTCTGNFFALGLNQAVAYTTNSANAASSGAFRMASGEQLCWRNNGNSANYCLSKNASDQFQFNAHPIAQVDTTQSFTADQTFTTQTIIQTANGGQWLHGQASELLTLSTSGTTSDTSANLLPANSTIEAVVARVTTTITTATDWKLGDATIAGRFSAANSTMTSGTTQVGTLQVDQTGTSGPRQVSAAKVRVTTTGTPGAGAIRITVFYRQYVPPTS